MQFAFFLILLLFSCEQKKKYHPLGLGEYFVSGCSVFDEAGKLHRNFGLGHCLFFPDGRVFHAKEKQIEMRDGKGQKIWQKRIPSHHLPVQNGNQIIVLSSEDKLYQGKLTRFDVLVRLSLDGEVLSEWHVFDHLPQLKEKVGSITAGPAAWFPESKAVQEFTHINSVFAITNDSSLKGSDIFQSGNYLVNLHLPSNAGLVLDSEWKNIVWVSSYRTNSHDLQLINGGKLLLFRNRQTSEDKSSLEVISLPDEKIYWNYGLNSTQNFYSKVGGTVQKLRDGNFLFTSGDSIEQIKIVDEGGKKVWGLNPNIPFLNPMLDVKILHLEAYLKQSQN